MFPSILFVVFNSISLRGFQTILVENWYPLPRIDDLLDYLKYFIFFTKLDLMLVYHQIPIESSYVWKTDFKTKESLFQLLDIPFGLTDAPTN